MQAAREYDIAIAKIPRTDRSRKDITEDKLGGGGRHRADWTCPGFFHAAFEGAGSTLKPVIMPRLSFVSSLSRISSSTHRYSLP